MTENSGMSRPEKAARVLREALAVSLTREAFEWLDETTRAISEGASRRKLFGLFSSAVHRVGKDDLDVSDRVGSVAAIDGWDVASLSCDEATRILILLLIPSDDAASYAKMIDEIHETADVGEAAAIQKALPVLPHPATHAERAAVGIRSNITAVFDAVALRNPYPRDYLDDGAFRQMVLKAIFVGSEILDIIGLDERADAELARMLVDYAHERWAAGRPVVPSLWRPVGPHADIDAVSDLSRLLSEGSAREKYAAALALAACPRAEAVEALSAHVDLANSVAEGRVTWNDVRERADEESS